MSQTLYHPPYLPHELDRHPDRRRIQATLDVLRAEIQRDEVELRKEMDAEYDDERASYDDQIADLEAEVRRLKQRIRIFKQELAQ
jgi:phage host-nuclease inhibitor protein Gam